MVLHKRSKKKSRKTSRKKSNKIGYFISKGRIYKAYKGGKNSSGKKISAKTRVYKKKATAKKHLPAKKSRKRRSVYGGNKGDIRRSTRRAYSKKRKSKKKSKFSFKVKDWGSKTPSSTENRRKLYKLKPSCYLLPGKRPKYPICELTRKSGRWDFNSAKITRQGILAAYSRSATQKSASSPSGAYPNKKINRDASKVHKKAAKLRNKFIRKKSRKISRKKR